MRDLPDVVAKPKAPHAAALVREIARVYRISKSIPAEITRRAEIADPAQPGRWARGLGAIGKDNAPKLRKAFPLCAKAIDDAVSKDAALSGQRRVGITAPPIVARDPEPPPPLLDLWPRLDDTKRAAVVRVAELLAAASGGDWIDEQVDALAAVARRHPLSDRSAGGAS